MVVLERRRHRHQERIGCLRLERSAQIARLNGGMHQHVQFRLDDVDLAAVDGIDRVLGHIDADHVLFARGEHRGGRQADIAQADHGNGVETGRHGGVTAKRIRRGNCGWLARCGPRPGHRHKGSLPWPSLGKRRDRRAVGWLRQRCVHRRSRPA